MMKNLVVSIEVDRPREFEQVTCRSCDGTGTFFDPTNADKVDASSVAGTCPTCRGRKTVGKLIAWVEEIPAWRLTSEIGNMPEWMC